MIRLFRIAALLLLIFTLITCGPSGSGGEYSKSVYPYDMQVDVDRNQMTISWKKHGNGAISGYNIYISDKELAKDFPGSKLPSTVNPFNASFFPGDTDPSDGIEHFLAEGLENGKKFFVSVRVVFPDRSLSKPSEEILAVCGSRGDISLVIRNQGKNDGYSFYEDRQVGADNESNDIYFFYGSWEEVKFRFKESDLSGANDRVEIKTGDWVHARTPEGHQALILIKEIKGNGKSRSIELFFALSTLVEGVHF